MREFLEQLKALWTSFLEAVGLKKREVKPPTPSPKPDPKPPTPSPVTELRFYGPFIPQWGSLEMRELVQFDFNHQTHGCPPHETEYGIEDPIGNGVEFMLHITRGGQDEPERIFSRYGNNVTDAWVQVDRLFWIPGYTQNAAPPWLPRGIKLTDCPKPPAPTPPDPAPDMVSFVAVLKVRAPTGQTWQWVRLLAVAKTGCSD
jgi:hypothetical protein